MSVIGNFLDGFLKAKGAILNEQPFNLCDLETNQDDFTFVGKGGEFATMIKLSGIESLIGEEEFNEITPSLAELLKSIFLDGHHVLDASFTRDNRFTKRDIERASAPSKETAKLLDLDIENLIDEDNALIDQYTIHEEQYLMLWTLPTAISNTEIKEYAKEKAEIRKKIGFGFTDAQSHLVAIPMLKNYHDATVSNFTDELGRMGFHVEAMDVHSACRAIRMQILPAYTSHSWKPILSGDNVTPHTLSVEPPKDDLSELLYPNLGWQLCPFDAEIVENFTYIGGRYYATILFEVFPSNYNIEPFIRLFERIKPYIPYRIRYLMSGKALDWLTTLRQQIATFMAFLPNNRDIVDSITNLQEYERSGGVAIKTRLSLTTWSADINELKSNVEEITRAVQAWGNPQVILEKGNPTDAFFGGLIGFTRKSVATGTPVPSEALVSMLPFYRPAAPWSQGAMKFRTIDGKPWYYQPNSHLQGVNINLIVGLPGNGKGVISNSLNLARVLAPGAERLPRISIIETEPSSLGFINMIQNRCNENQKHLALYHRMNRRDGTNPFDTLLGLRYPTTSDLEFLIDFLVILTSPKASGENPYSEMRELLGEVITQTYDYYASPKSAKIYQEGLNEKVDKKLTELGFFDGYKDNNKPSWWDAVDFLFTNRHPKLAEQAQKFAVPLMDDMLSLALENVALESRYSQVQHNGEPYINLMARKLSSIVREYPCFSKPTEVDLSQARIISLDLADVATTPHSTAIFAAFGAWITSRFFYIKKEKLPLFKEIYRAYYDSLLTDIKRDKKDLIVEEYHRYHEVPGVSRMVERFMAEGRKDDVNTTVISQLLAAFTSPMRKMATNQFLLVAGISNEELTEMQKLINLSNTEMVAIRSGMIHTPKADGSGSSFLFRYMTRGAGRMKSQVLVNTRPATMLWEFSTSTNDTELRSVVYKKLGSERGVEALVHRFPKGSADSYIEKLKAESSAEERLVVGSIVIDEVAKEVIDIYYKKEGFIDNV